MSGFRTKLDFSNNRQVKQRIETTTVLSGATSFGVPYNQLPSGPNYALSTVTQTLVTTSASTGTFSGNNTTTVFTWPISELYLADSTLSAITPSNSGTPQTTGYVLTADTNSLFTVDGNSGYGSYTGVGFTMFATTFYGLGGGNYSGTVQYTNVELIQAPGLDYSGRTIWSDTSGITRTERLIITDNPQVGYVWTCIDSEGMGEWQPSSGSSSGSTSTIWTAGTGANSAVLGGSGGIASNINSVSEGHQTTASGYASHAEGNGTLASGDYSHAEGMSDSSQMTTASGLGSHAEGAATIASGNYSHSQGFYTTASGDSSHAGGIQTTVNGDYSFGHSAFALIDVDSDYSAILGGESLTINKSKHSSILGGHFNYISGGTSGNTYNMILGGKNNEVYNHSYSTIINGSGNTIHFDLGDFSKPNNFEMIENSIDSVISASTLSKISSSDRMTITNSVSSTVINAVASSFDQDPYNTSGGIIGTDTDGDNGVNTIISTYDGLIRYKASSNTIIGSVIARIDGTSGGGGGGAYSNFIGNSSSITISDQYNTSGHSSNNTVLGSYASGMKAPNTYSSIMGSSYVSMEYSDTSSIISSIDSDILTGVTSSIIGGTGNTLTTTNSSIILGGNLNSLNTAYYSIIAGGSGNTITKNTDNLTQPKYSGIFVGFNNKIIPRYGSSSVGMSASYCAIVGGESNTISGHSHSFIGGGFNNLIACDADYNAIIGGQNNINHAANGVIIGGQSNTLGNSPSCPSTADNSVIIGGNFNFIDSSLDNTDNSVILGGTQNKIGAGTAGGEALESVVLGGNNNILTASTTSAIIAGNNNTITNKAVDSAILAGYNNAINGHKYSVILGGTGNTIDFDFYAGENNSEAIIGSYDCTLTSTTRSGIMSSFNSIVINSYDSTVIGGRNNNITQCFNSAIIGGEGNTIGASGTDTDNVVIIACTNYNATAGSAGLVVVPQLIITGLTSVSDLQTNASGQLVNGTSDANLKQNIQQLPYGLEAIKQLRGVSFEYTPESNMGGGVKYGFIAQEVQKVLPTIVRPRVNDTDNLSLNYNEIIPVLVEAVKELSTGITTSNNTHLETQTILAEDNNVELNFNGTQQTAIGGGLSILHAKGQDQSADLITDADGNFVTNNDFKPNALTIPFYTPSSSNDVVGNEGNITRDDNYLYVKTSSGWKRTNLESF